MTGDAQSQKENSTDQSIDEMSIPSESELALQLAKGGMSTIVQLIRSMLVKTQLVQDAL